MVSGYEQTLFMNTGKCLWVVPVVLLTFAVTLPVQGDDRVTISKSRLEELERKEAELEKLKKEADKAESGRQQLESEQRRLKSEAVELKKAKEAAVAAAASVAPAIQHDTPAIATLPPVQKGEVLDAMDLMNHYRSEAAAAGKRYGAQPIRVKGEAVHFEKPGFVRYYLIYLKTTDRNWKVACRVYPPEKYSAVFTAKGGEDLVATTGSGARAVIARLGQTIVVEGRCQGLRDQMLNLTGCTLQESP